MNTPKLHIKKGDKVVIITGKDRGKEGEVVRVLPKQEKVVVGGLNTARKHVRGGRGSEAGIVEREMPIHISNVKKV